MPTRSTGTTPDPDPEPLLTHWFDVLRPRDWFRTSDAVDAELRRLFGALHDRVAADVPPHWRETPRGLLAGVLALDQLPRNLFRGTARAYATDGAACALVDAALAAGADRSLSKVERHFLYLPFMHAEDVALQARSVALYRALDHLDTFEHARGHQAVVAQFGRFPHRNAVLGRVSTPEETAYLATRRGVV